jgi:hypothetical protein
LVENNDADEKEPREGKLAEHRVIAWMNSWNKHELGTGESRSPSFC